MPVSRFSPALFSASRLPRSQAGKTGCDTDWAAGPGAQESALFDSREKYFSKDNGSQVIYSNYQNYKNLVCIFR